MFRLVGSPPAGNPSAASRLQRSEEHTSELQSHLNLVCRLLLEKKKHTSELQSHLNHVCRLLLEKKNTKLKLALRSEVESGGQMRFVSLSVAAAALQRAY